MKKILIIGGTQFIGRTITEKLISDGRYELCLFNRGQTNPDLFPSVRQLKGDRYTTDIEQIGQEEWDCIIDLTAYHPDALRNTLRLIKDRVDQYILISTMSVYDFDPEVRLVSEEHPILTCDAEQRVSKEMETYGCRKAACEQELLSMADLPSLILRPMLVVGPYDHTDRLYYWLHRTQFYDQIVVPDHGTHHMGGWTDVNGFAEVVVRSILRTDLERIYNVPTAAKVSIDQVVTAAAKVLGKNPQRVSISGADLREQKVKPWWDLPLWVGGDYYIMDDAKLRRDFAINFKSVEDSVRDSINYVAAQGWPEPSYGMSREREEELIQLFK